MLKTFLTASALSLAVVSAASAATIVQNGSFEIGTESLTSPSWAIYPGGLPGWTTTTGGIEVQTAGTVGLTPDDGDHYVELDGNSNYTMSQSVALTVGQYLLSFAYSPRDNHPSSNGIAYSLGNDDADIFAKFITGPDSAPPATTVGQWTTITLNFIISNAGSYVLSFAGGGTSNSYGGFLDNVKIASVPVPAAGLLLLGALAGLAGLRRRKTV